MAEDTTDTRPGSDPGVLTTGADGSVPDLKGRQAWVWMQDTDAGGGGRFDVRADRVDLWKRKGATVVPGYPLNFDRSARTAKPRRSLTGEQPAAAAAPTVTGGTLADQPPAGEDAPADDRMNTRPEGYAEPADERLDTAPADTAEAPAEADTTNQDAGDAGDTTSRKGGRRR